MSRDPKKLHPIVSKLLYKFQKEARKHEIEFIITSTLRDEKEQNALFNKGRSYWSRVRGERIVTNVKFPNSFHNHGVAFDIVPVKNGKAIWNDHALWDKLGQIGKSIGLEWGGDWTRFKDKPHFQFTQGLSINDFASGKTLDDGGNKPSHWASESWKKAKKKGVFSKNSDPLKTVTKQELAVILDRVKLI